MQQTLSDTSRPVLLSRPTPGLLTGAATSTAARSALPVGLSLVLAFCLYPLWWALGLQLAAWPVSALLLGVWLVRRRSRLSVPTGFGLWLLFLAWTVASALVLHGSDRVLAWGYREAMYVSGTVVLLFLVNVSPREFSTRLICRLVLTLWALTIVTGSLGIVVPDLSFTSLAELVLPSSVTSVRFIADQIHPDFGNSTELLGVTRPSALYSYTNSWGAALGILTPMALYARTTLTSAWTRLAFWALLVASLVPVVVSVNRGLWVSLVVAALFVAGRGLLQGRPAVALGVLLGSGTVALAVLLSPLLGVLQKRLETPNVGTRETLVGAAVQLVGGSPLLGYGAPQSVSTIADTNDVNVGTHGQLWTLLVSQGYPGTFFYFAFFLVALVATWQLRQAAWWLQAAVAVFLVQALFYNALPVPLVLVMVALALCLREQAAGVDRAPPPALAADPDPGRPRAARPLLPRTTPRLDLTSQKDDTRDLT